MAIEVTPRVRREIQRRDLVYVCVRGVEDPSAAAQALSSVRQEIASIGGADDSSSPPSGRGYPNYVSPVLMTPDGPFITIDWKATPVSARMSLPDVVVDGLVRHGIDVAVVDTPTGRHQRFDEIDGLTNIAALHVFPQPRIDRNPILRAWRASALEFVQAQPAPSIWLEIDGFQIELNPSEAHELLLGDGLAGAIAVRVVGSLPDGSTALVSLSGGVHRQVMFAIAGDEARLTERATVLIGLGMSMAAGGAVYMCIELSERLMSIGGLNTTAWRSDGGAQPGSIVELCDRFVPDAFPWQMLSRGHIEQLGGIPPGAEALGKDRYSLSVGAIQDWIPGHPVARASRLRARDVLAKCLLRDEEASVLAAERRSLAQKQTRLTVPEE